MALSIPVYSHTWRCRLDGDFGPQHVFHQHVFLSPTRCGKKREGGGREGEGARERETTSAPRRQRPPGRPHGDIIPPGSASVPLGALRHLRTEGRPARPRQHPPGAAGAAPARLSPGEPEARGF